MQEAAGCGCSQAVLWAALLLGLLQTVAGLLRQGVLEGSDGQQLVKPCKAQHSTHGGIEMSGFLAHAGCAGQQRQLQGGTSTCCAARYVWEALIQ